MGKYIDEEENLPQTRPDVSLECSTRALTELGEDLSNATNRFRATPAPI